MNEDYSIQRLRHSRRLAGVVLAVLLVVVGGSVVWHQWGRSAARADELLDEARVLRAQGENERAERLAAQALKLDPASGEAALLAAESAAAQGEYGRAVDYTQSVPARDPRIRLRAGLMAARWNHHRLDRFSKAEQAYRTVLRIEPDHVEANTGLAKLLGMCARRSEAIPHVLRVVRSGEPTDLLVMLARDSGIINDREALKRARRAAPDDPNPCMGLAWHAAESGDAGEAIELLREALRLQPDHAAAHVALGRQLLAARRFDELVPWSRGVPGEAERFAGTWIIRARMAEHDEDEPAAIRCYWEAARRAAESKTVNFRLAQLLAENDETDASRRFAAHLRRLQELTTMQDRVLFSAGISTDGVAPLLELATSYERAGRLWEAYGWCRIAVESAPYSAEAQRRYQELRPKVAALPLRLTADSANVAMETDLSSYPLPEFRKSSASSAHERSLRAGAISFRNDAESAGLRFRYFNGTAGPPTRRMYEFTGGGIGVLDFDLDGFPDVYFTQGKRWPPDGPSGPYGDRLFWNREGARFEDVTAQLGIREDGFGQGVTVGDFNADGFPDLYVANIGRNQLWMNNGDGTFAEQEEAGGDVEWTTSCVLADLNGDALPDIYAANYLTAGDVFQRVCKHGDGRPIACSPFHFDGEPDRLWLNDGAGGFKDATAEFLSVEPNGKGLGVAAWDADGTGRLSLYVANDLTPNAFFVPTLDEGGQLRLEERGIPSGMALNGEGKAEGGMGIALGDVANDGRFDVFVTNFLAESNTLYVNESDGVYTDRTRSLGLHDLSVDVLGFGTQFLDADLDTHEELFVANGHVDDLRRYGRPYRMPPQLLRWDGRGFTEVDGGPYFRKKWLGRAAARLDWNGDGRQDIVVGHLDDQSALLTNTTGSTGQSLSLGFIGLKSPRDAIGTVVRASIGDRIFVRQLTAGDGYQASNERRIVLGGGDAKRIDELRVQWPSGIVQTFANVPLPGDFLLVEGGTLVPTSRAKN